MLNYIRKLVEFLNDEINDVQVKASPEAINAPQYYDLTDAKGVILVWLDSVPNYADINKKIETEELRTHIYYRTNWVVVSVGLRTFVGSPDLDVLVEKIETKLIHLKIGDYSPLRPISISKLMVDANNVYWRQMLFETRKKIIGHPVQLVL